MVKDRYNENEISSIKLRLIGRQLTDNNYELSALTDIGGLIVRDISKYDEGRDIIIEDKTNILQRIAKLYPSYMALQYPLLFSYGEDGHRTDLS
ncbi:LOW QUALITY PROTEIN: hypothetical protein TorRG33x02_183480 [Trema orientale]|uniref:Uncharacterized protein n=1 Tax=Trema orientale TaxID=63057 RepID=A0A2P5EK28_TREOI|nr:LOW QUALITY PROTEIN: hypothetical protein TorRG33x02_183480 [Trema orientale]